MSRTGEMLLTFLGFIIYGFYAVVGGATVWMNKNQDKVASMLENVDNSELDVSKEEFLGLIQDIGGSGWLVLFGAAIALIAGIVAIYFLRGNKNALAAGWTLILAAVISSIMTYFVVFIGGIVYVIAGIMSLVRKPKSI